MELNRSEHIIRTYHHHPFPFIIQVIKVVLSTFPFFFITYLFSPTLHPTHFFIINLCISFFFTIVLVYLALIYWLDKLVITNQRIVMIDWKYLTLRIESEALLNDIQDVHTQEKGIFSIIPLFDYGIFRVETASSKTTLIFSEAPDPEGIKAFLYHHIKSNCIPIKHAIENADTATSS